MSRTLTKKLYFLCPNHIIILKIFRFWKKLKVMDFHNTYQHIYFPYVSLSSWTWGVFNTKFQTYFAVCVFLVWLVSQLYLVPFFTYLLFICSVLFLLLIYQYDWWQFYAARLYCNIPEIINNNGRGRWELKSGFLSVCTSKIFIYSFLCFFANRHFVVTGIVLSWAFSSFESLFFIEMNQTIKVMNGQIDRFFILTVCLSII